MENIIMLFACLAIGMALRGTHWVPENAHTSINAFIIYVSLPALTPLQIHSVVPDPSLLYAALMPFAGEGTAPFASPDPVSTALARLADETAIARARTWDELRFAGSVACSTGALLAFWIAVLHPGFWTNLAFRAVASQFMLWWTIRTADAVRRLARILELLRYIRRRQGSCALILALGFSQNSPVGKVT